MANSMAGRLANHTPWVIDARRHPRVADGTSASDASGTGGREHPRVRKKAPARIAGLLDTAQLINP
jgi:hypothetical protein